MELSQETRQKISLYTQDWIKRARAMYQLELEKKGYDRLPPISIDFNKRGNAAASVIIDRNGNGKPTAITVSYNPYFFDKDPNTFYYETIPHEIAHVIVAVLYDDVKPHGMEWQGVMKRFGIKPKEFTDTVVDNVPDKKRHLYMYKCIGCGHKRVLGEREHKQAERKGITCENCGEPMFLEKKTTL